GKLPRRTRISCGAEGDGDARLVQDADVHHGLGIPGAGCALGLDLVQAQAADVENVGPAVELFLCEPVAIRWMTSLRQFVENGRDGREVADDALPLVLVCVVLRDRPVCLVTAIQRGRLSARRRPW